MPYVFALTTGFLLALMVFLNGQLSTISSTHTANILFHGIGLLIFCGILIIVVKKQPHSFLKEWKEAPLSLVIPGFLSAATILLSNLVLQHLSVSLLVGISLLGQILTSTVIDTLGLLGKEKTPLTWHQWLGSASMFIGVWLLLG